MKDYFYNKFPGQLRKVEFQRPNEIEREIFEDENILFKESSNLLFSFILFLNAL